MNVEIVIIISTYLNVYFYLGVRVSSELQCYKCLRLTCHSHPLESEFCPSLHHFVQNSLKSFYQIEAAELPSCPNPIHDEVAWETLKTVSPNPVTCPGHCTLGRFQLTSLLRGDQERIINHGTVLGCAKPRLSDNILRKSRKNQKSSCYWENVTSVVRLNEQVEHTMALEHCPRPGDICSSKNFCIDSHRSLILPFEQVETSNSGFVIGVICVVSILCVLVMIATFAGMKYGQ